MTYTNGVGPGQSIMILLILALLAFAPMLVRRALRTDGDDLQAEADAEILPAVMTPVQALARHMYGDACHWDNIEMLNYDGAAWVREPWERSAAARLDRDRVGPAYPPEATNG